MKISVRNSKLGSQTDTNKKINSVRKVRAQFTPCLRTEFKSNLLNKLNNNNSVLSSNSLSLNLVSRVFVFQGESKGELRTEFALY